MNFLKRNLSNLAWAANGALVGHLAIKAYGWTGWTVAILICVACIVADALGHMWQERATLREIEEGVIQPLQDLVQELYKELNQ